MRRSKAFWLGSGCEVVAGLRVADGGRKHLAACCGRLNNTPVKESDICLVSDLGF